MAQRHATPRPEEWSAYFDGELSGPRLREMECWLADHPEAQADLEEWRQLSALTRTTRAADPGEAAWADVYAALPAPPRRTWTRRLVLSAASLAAAIAFAVWLTQPAPSQYEELVVASPADVEIISMDAADVPALVVGLPPAHEPLVLAESADIDFDHIEPAHDGSMPAVHWWVDDEAPMIVAVAER